MTEWGPSLTGPECIQLRLPGDTPVRCDDVSGKASMWSFGWKDAIYTLPANHPAYKVAEYNRNHPEAPMVYHGGSDEAPKDWKPGSDVLFANGNVPIPEHNWAWRWGGAPFEFNIIGYVPTPVEEARPATEELKECVRLSRELFSEESDTVTLKRMTEAEWFEASRDSFTSWAHSVGLIREETLLEQFEREVCLGTRIGQNERNVALAVIDWMEKRQGDKS